MSTEKRMSSEMELPGIIAKNIAELRKSHGMTQAGLAEQLGYSDKSVSKWERADGVPDVICLKKIADMFGVTVDYLLEAEHDNLPEADKNVQTEASEEIGKATGKYVTNRRAVGLLSVVGVWTLACLVYIITKLCGYDFYLPFVVALPVTALLLVIFHSLWSGEKYFRIVSFLTISALVWSVLFLICYVLRAREMWLLMVLGVPAMVVVALACLVRKRVDENTDMNE